MKRRPALILVFVVIASMAWVSGCRSPEAPVMGTDDIATRQQNPDLNDEYGGFNMMDEAPAFGDDVLSSEFAGDATYNDPFASDIEDVEASDAPRLFLMITWGNLHRDEGISHRREWKGSLRVDPGVIVLRRTIRFEPTDRIVPRTERDLLEWETITGLGMDGILVRIVPRPSDTATNDSIDPENTIIKFSMNPVEAEFRLSELPDLHKVVTLDDGNAVALNAVVLPPSACPHGFLRGVWRNHPERPGGVYFGHWATADGEVKGFLRGIYGVNDEGQKVFFGKMIDTRGRFEGIVRGKWDSHPENENGGWFAGHWVDRNRMIKGGLRGEWRWSPQGIGGFFRGAWAVACETEV